ncbi:hypothetical protein MRB53_040460 [Persea americana]|nr:hypothetical protein MRB53_040460 [Persea americana]
MPGGFERLNVKVSQPNDRIAFIKPQDGPDKQSAQDFLNRIAAICVPIMKANHLVVTTLEEYPPNKEFWGRNFNRGEIIQLVLKTHAGRWLPFRSVQMVMMHEVKNQFSSELKTLWAKNYSGEGLWGRGQALDDGQYMHGEMPHSENMPENLCGGTFRSRWGKRGRKKNNAPELTYAEKKQRRIEKKFGTGGTALGADEDTRYALETGKQQSSGNPRVANSKRGRELRAAAALARFGPTQATVDTSDTDSTMTARGSKSGLDDNSEGEDDSEYDEPIVKEEGKDQEGHTIVDADGRPMLRVCGDDDGNADEEQRRELEELGSLGSHETPSTKRPLKTTRPAANEHLKRLESSANVVGSGRSSGKSGGSGVPSDSIPSSTALPSSVDLCDSETEDEAPPQRSTESRSETICEVCSLSNPPDSLTCLACANVLDTKALPGSWSCSSTTCKESKYRNAQDVGACGICGTVWK